MAYYAVNKAQEYIQSLGFTNVNNEPQRLKADKWGQDNSAYWPNYDTIKFGKGDVDDAEDVEVIWHEYGHAIQDDQVKDFGTTLEAGSIGEGFGDYWAFTMSVGNNPGDPACIADWDSTGYAAGPPFCLRRLDTSFHWPEDDFGEVHRNGRMWSRALYDIHRALGRTVTDRIVLESQFLYTPDETFAAASNAAIATAERLYGKRAAKVAHDAFAARGFVT
jgi:Zn-dependent metalloprotease